MIIILNNKTNFTRDEFLDYKNHLSQINYYHPLILCPSSCYLPFCQETTLGLGAQNVSKTNSKSATGEITAPQLKSLNVNYCLVGHSERRKYQKESNEEINKKLGMLLDNEITPILCVGENKNEKEANMTTVKIMTEIKDAFKDIEDTSKIIIAYEPIWAIGTGITPNREEIDNVLRKIKEDYPENLLLYGGSLSAENIEEINKSTYIDGYLLGGLSLKVEELRKFLKIIG